MKNLIVYTHPNPVSFGNAIKEQVIAACKSMGREYVLRDLYEMGFDPVLKGSDFTGIQNGQIPLDVKVEQEHILTADIITFVYPVWWTGMPALLKGYIDRVFSYGFAYTVNDGGIVPLLKGKKVLNCNSKLNTLVKCQQTQAA